MTDFNRGDAVQPRDYAAKAHPRYATQVGEYQGYRAVGHKKLLTVVWPDESTTEWPASYLKLARGPKVAEAMRVIAENRLRAIDPDEYDYERDDHVPTGATLDTSGFVPPETLSDDVRAGRVTVEVVDETQEFLGTAGDEDEVTSTSAPVEPTYGRCRAYPSCVCRNWTPGKKIGTWQVCTCTHTQGIHKVVTGVRAIRRSAV